MRKELKYFVDGKKVSFEYYSIIKIMKYKCFKERVCEKCDVTELCAGYDGTPLSADLKVE